MYVRLKAVSAVTKTGVGYRLQYPDGKLGKEYRLSCDRWVDVPDADLKNLVAAYGEDTFITSEKATAIKPMKVTLGGGAARRSGVDPQDPKNLVPKPKKAPAKDEEDGDLNEGDDAPEVKGDQAPTVDA